MPDLEAILSDPTQSMNQEEASVEIDKIIGEMEEPSESKSVQEEKQDEEEDLSPEEMFNKLTEDENKDTKDPASKGTEEEFELFVNGESLKVSKPEVIKLAQMGQDYTKKTQTLAEERKDFEIKYATAEKEMNDAVTYLEKRYLDLNDKVLQQQKWDVTLKTIARKDPDLYEQIKEYGQDVDSMLSNPVYSSQLQQQNARISELEKMLKEKESTSVAGEFTSGINQLMERYGKGLSKLGIKLDENAIKTSWITSGDSIDKAFWSVHGKQFAKLWESKAKAAQAISKSKARKKYDDTIPDIDLSEKEKEERPFRKISWDSLGERLAKSF